MSASKTQVAPRNGLKLSLDSWAVIVALAAAALVRFGVIPRVPW